MTFYHFLLARLGVSELDMERFISNLRARLENKTARILQPLTKAT